jgi:hypothetical protein
MVKIVAPNKKYSGLSAGIQFIDGVGECADPYLIDWFKSKGYTVELDVAELSLPVPDPDEDDEVLSDMAADELKSYAECYGIDIGKSTSRDGILKKIRAAQRK